MDKIWKQIASCGLIIIAFLGCGKNSQKDPSTGQVGTSEISQKQSTSEISDLVISGSQSLFSLRLTNSEQPSEQINATYKKIIFMDQATLYTNGANLNLVADEILFQNSTIDSFEPGLRKAAVGQNGASGGSIRITTKNAIGKVRVMLRGQDGGDAYPAASYSDRAEQGKPSQAAELARKTKNCSPFNLGGLVYGEKGASGKKGVKGHDGTNGGNTGTFSLETSSRDGLRLDVNFIPGYAGAPGDGGPGQQGGLGGTIVGATKTENGYAFLCDRNQITFRDGPEGEYGTQGDKGNSGLDGITETACIISESTAKTCYPKGNK